MIPWIDRPTEPAFLFNPAFGGLLLASAIQGHEKEGRAGLPIPLAMLIIPIVLHQPTLESLPNRITSSMPAWLEEHPEAMAGLTDRVRAFKGVSQESLLFLFSRCSTVLDFNNRLACGPTAIPSVAKQKKTVGDATYAAISSAGFLGRWFARTGDTATIMTLWGIRP